MARTPAKQWVRGWGKWAILVKEWSHLLLLVQQNLRGNIKPNCDQKSRKVHMAMSNHQFIQAPIGPLSYKQ